MHLECYRCLFVVLPEAERIRALGWEHERQRHAEEMAIERMRDERENKRIQEEKEKKENEHIRMEKDKADKKFSETVVIFQFFSYRKYRCSIAYPPIPSKTKSIRRRRCARSPTGW